MIATVALTPQFHHKINIFCVCVARIFKIFSLRKFKVYNAILLAIITM